MWWPVWAVNVGNCSASKRSALANKICLHFPVKKKKNVQINCKNQKFEILSLGRCKCICLYVYAICICLFSIVSSMSNQFVFKSISWKHTSSQMLKDVLHNTIYRLDTQWALFYANTRFAMEQSVLLLKISLFMICILYPALSICCTMLGKRIEQFVSNTPGRHPITPAAKCI